MRPTSRQSTGPMKQVRATFRNEHSRRSSYRRALRAESLAIGRGPSVSLSDACGLKLRRAHGGPECIHGLRVTLYRHVRRRCTVHDRIRLPIIRGRRITGRERANPFTLKTGDNVDSKWDAYLDEAIARLDRGCASSTGQGGRRGEAEELPADGRARSKSCNRDLRQHRLAGIAQIWITGGTHITQGDHEAERHYFNTADVQHAGVAPPRDVPGDRARFRTRSPGRGLRQSRTSDRAWTTRAIPTAAAHTVRATSTRTRTTSSRSATIYAHLDSTTHGRRGVAAGSSPAGDDRSRVRGPGQWGRLRQVDPERSRPDLELDFGDGQKIMTHVFWADPDSGCPRQPRSCDRLRRAATLLPARRWSCASAAPQSSITRDRAICDRARPGHLAAVRRRRHADVRRTADDVWQVTLKGRLPGQPPMLFETSIVGDRCRDAGAIVSVAKT